MLQLVRFSFAKWLHLKIQMQVLSWAKTKTPFLWAQELREMASSTARRKEILSAEAKHWSRARHLQQNLSRIWVCCSEFACLNQSVWWWWWLNWVYESLSFALSVQSLSLLAEMACNMRGWNYKIFRPESAFSENRSCSTMRQWWYKPPKSILLHSTLQSCMAANQN